MSHLCLPLMTPSDMEHISHKLSGGTCCFVLVLKLVPGAGCPHQLGCYGPLSWLYSYPIVRTWLCTSGHLWLQVVGRVVQWLEAWPLRQDCLGLNP